jgi:hypothetical protein
MNQASKDHMKFNRTCVARGHLKELQRKGNTVVKDAAVIAILEKMTDNLVINKVEGPLKRINRDMSSCWCCHRQLVCPNMVKKLLLKDGIQNVKRGS